MRLSLLGEKNKVYMTQMANKVTPIPRGAPQPPMSPGATPDSDRTKRPPLADQSSTDQELIPGDRVEGLGTSASRLEKSAQWT